MDGPYPGVAQVGVDWLFKKQERAYLLQQEGVGGIYTELEGGLGVGEL